LNLQLALVLAYSIAIVAIGLWTSRLVRNASDFFVAGRGLSGGLVFASMIAANIGAGATIGAAGLAYRDGLSAWWWSGSAGIGSLVLAFWAGPRLWRLASTHGFLTTGDYLEFRYGAGVRATVAVIIALISLVILAAQLIAGAAILSAITGVPRWVGAVLGGIVMTSYFAAGGLLGTAWVNVLQLLVMLAGFLVALPFTLGAAGGLDAIFAAVPAAFGDITYSSGPGSGWTFLFLTGPAFVISPGLIQKAYGAASERALRFGVGLNALALMLFAFLPVLLGLSARALIPDLASPDLALPTLLTRAVPAWLGAIALAALFSTAVDTCDGILFMLSTSVAQDIYRKHVKPTASDADLLRVVRIVALMAGAAGVLLSIYLASVIGALRVFYSVLGVSLFVPVLGGLAWSRAGAREAFAAITAGLATLATIGLTPIGDGNAWLDPTFTGIVVSAIAFGVALATRPCRIDSL
jgi:SSS family solute:Na+ symporter